uniref:Uncharacterized protein n=1 Tax=Arundo donax TaxID=35708 RepID=A0A0A9CFN1_ARUDO
MSSSSNLQIYRSMDGSINHCVCKCKCAVLT